MVDIAEIMIKLKGDASDLERASSQAKSSFSGLQSGLAGIGKGSMAVGAALTAGITVPLMAIGALALKSSSDIGGAFRVITQQTGATGATLESLKGTFKTVFSTVPVDANAAAQSISYLHQRLGDLGPTLTALETEMVNLSRITGTDLVANTKSVADAFASWKIKTADQTSTLNELYKVSVVAAIPFQTLLDALQQYAPVLQAMNLSFTDSALLIGNLTKAGIDFTPVLSGLRTWMGKVAQEQNKANAAMDGTAKGAEKAQEILSKVPTSFETLYSSIKNATTYQEGFNKAVAAFGPRSAAVMTKAIRENVLNLTEFKKLVASSGLDINTMAANTTTLSDAMVLFKQKVELAFAPLGTTIGSALKGALGSLDPFLVILQKLGTAFDMLPAPVKNAIVLFGAIAAAIGPTVLSAGGFISAIVQVTSVVGGAVGGVGLLSSAFSLLLPVILILAIPLASLMISVGLLAAGFIVAYQSSATLREIISTLSDAFTTFGASASKAAGLFLAGKWNEGFAEIGKGINGLLVTLGTIDWNIIGSTIVNEIRNGITNHKSAILTAFDNFATDAAKWIQSQDWGMIGQSIGHLIAGGLHVILTGSTTGLQSILDEFLGSWKTKKAAAAVGVETTGTQNQPTGPSDLTTVGNAAVTSFIAGFKAGLAAEPWEADIKSAIKVAGPVSIDILADVTVKWPTDALFQSLLGSAKSGDIAGGITKSIAFEIILPGMEGLQLLYDILKWVIDNFSVHDVGFNINMGDTAGLKDFHDTLKWIVNNFSVHEIGFNISIFGMDKLNGAIDTWNNFNIHAGLGPWDIGGQKIPSIGWGGATIPSVGWNGFTVPSVGWNGFTVPSVGWNGFTVPSVGWNGATIPSVGWGGATIPSVGWNGATIPSVGWGGTSLGVPGFTIPGFDAGVLGKWDGYTWGGVNVAVPGFNTPTWNIPGFSTGAHTIPGFSTGTHAIPGFSTGAHTIPGFSTGTHAIPGFSTGAHTIPGFSTGALTIPGFSTGEHSIPQVHIPGLKLDWDSPDIPHFRSGGYVDKETLAVVGERPEYIVPADQMRGNVTNTYITNKNYYINGIKMDEVVDELKKKDKQDQLMAGDWG
jgi:phage-related minor tail protein